MKTQNTTTTNNSIYTYTFLGVLLFIAALSFTVVNFPHIAAFELSSTLVAGTLGFSSFSLLYKAIKDDKDRLRQQV